MMTKSLKYQSIDGQHADGGRAVDQDEIVGVLVEQQSCSRAVSVVHGDHFQLLGLYQFEGLG